MRLVVPSPVDAEPDPRTMTAVVRHHWEQPRYIGRGCPDPEGGPRDSRLSVSRLRSTDSRRATRRNGYTTYTASMTSFAPVQGLLAGEVWHPPKTRPLLDRKLSLAGDAAPI